MSYHAAKADLKIAIGIDTSSFALKLNLASLKAEVDNIYVEKLKNVSTNLSNLKSEVDKLNIDSTYSCWFKQTKQCSKKWCC